MFNTVIEPIFDEVSHYLTIHGVTRDKGTMTEDIHCLIDTGATFSYIELTTLATFLNMSAEDACLFLRANNLINVKRISFSGIFGNSFAHYIQINNVVIMDSNKATIQLDKFYALCHDDYYNDDFGITSTTIDDHGICAAVSIDTNHKVKSTVTDENILLGLDFIHMFDGIDIYSREQKIQLFNFDKDYYQQSHEFIEFNPIFYQRGPIMRNVGTGMNGLENLLK